MIKQAVFTCALFALTPAWAINKCMGPDGRVSFQDAPCLGQGEKIEVRPASGSAPKPAAHTSAASDSASAAAVPAQPTAPGRKENVFGERWQRRTYLENRGIPDARAAIDGHQADCAAQQAQLASKKKRATNSLAGATWEDSISGEMQAAATMCDSRARELRAELDSLQRELRDLQAKP